MTGTAQRPLQLLDVDGPFIPFGTASRPHPAYETGPGSPDTGASPLLTTIDPRHGPRLAALPCKLVWATTWREDANAWIAPRIGLPPSPVVSWPEPSEDGGTARQEDQDERDGLHWKTRTLVAHAALPTGELTGTLSTWGDASRSCQGWPASFSDVGPQVGTLSLAVTRRHGMPAP